MANHSTLYLVDGSSYLYRAFHALPGLTSADGRPTGAVFGVANMLRRLRDQYQPTHAAVVFDAPGETHRHEAFSDYKANRPPMPDELRAQVKPLHELIEALGWPLLVVPGVEADDVIATLARQARDAGMDVLISSGDKDLAQLVGAGVVMEDTMAEKRYDDHAVAEKFGVGPALLGDLLALTGDKADNIPGVEKVGPKTAAKWLNQYGSLDQIIANADRIGGKIGDNLRAAADRLPLSRQLVSLKDDVALDRAPGDLELGAGERESLAAQLKQLGFSSWLKQLDEAAGAAPTGLETELVTTRDRLQALVARCERSELMAFDTETTSLEVLDAELVGLAFSDQAGQAWYVPLAHADQDTEFTREEVLDIFKSWLENSDAAKVGQNLKYDLNVLVTAGIVMRGIAHDTMLQSYVLHSTATRHDMDSLAGRYLQRSTISYETVAGKGKQQVTFDQVPVAQAAEYAGEDAEITLCLHQALWPRLEQQPGPANVYRELELPLIPVLARMERTGVLIDRQRLENQGAELAGRIGQIEQQAYEVAGGEFNLGSPKQLQEILFERLGLPPKRKTPTGQPSTAEDVLAELAREFELPRLILEHRSLSKLKSTYIDRLPEKIHRKTGRVHTSYHQAVAATGRLSSSDPNLQNIPIRTEQGRRIRKAFIAPPGHVLLAADYSQVELRIMAHLSGDERLLAAFAAGEDIHRATAGEVFGLPPDQVGSDQRRAAKAINFGLMYGMSAWGLSRQLEIPRNEAENYIERYFERYPGVKAFMEATREAARKQGYVETLAGRRLWLDEIGSRNMQRRQAAERAAINAPMQGSAADIIKRAMIKIDHWLQETALPARLIMQVHDELVLEVSEDALDEVRDGVSARMSQAAELKVDLVVDCGAGKDWDEAH